MKQTFVESKILQILLKLAKIWSRDFRERNVTQILERF